ncbi:MAG: Gfo/Idh/MocA family oxidoreductase [Firmicutes bacterium]|nr:Gfo/Idh/MocA family oxidoreductase [Bacillota bacterium]
MLKFAMLSAWHVHAEGYAQEINAHPETVVALVWDDDPVRGEEFARKLGVPFEPDLKKVLQDEEIDAVCVNTATTLHRDVLTAAAKAGKHIFTEKVLAPTCEEAYAIANAVNEAGVKFVISFPHRAKPHNLFAKQVVEQGLLGDISLLRIRNAHNGASANWLPPHFYSMAECGGGAMMDLGAHGMYLAAWLLGKPKRISAVFSHITGKEVEDNAVAVMEFENGATAINETSFLSSNSPFSLELYGTEGSLLIGGPDLKVQLNSNLLGSKVKGWVQPTNLPKALPSALEQLVGAILRNEPVHFTVDDAVLLTELMDGAYRSHRLGQHITYPLT